METTHANIPVGCPACKAQIAVGDGGTASCISCGWAGSAMVFRPRQLENHAAQDALPDDATCVHHTSKRAVATCSGSGDYICALCSIEVDGKVYSAQHLDSAGKATVSEAFDRYLPRPDRAVVSFLIFCFVPWVNMFWMLGAPIWVPVGYVKLFTANRLRQNNPLYGQVVGPVRLVVMGILLTLFAGMLLLGTVAVIAAIIHNWNKNYGG